MNTTFYFLASFVVGIIIGSFIIGKVTTTSVQASAPVPTVETLPSQPIQNPVVENVVSFVTYALLISAGVMIWKKVGEQKPHYRPGEKLDWKPI